MIDIQIYGFMMLISLTLIGVSFIKFQDKHIKQGLRLIGSILLLLMSYLMIGGISYNTGAIITEDNSTTTTIVDTNNVFQNTSISLLLILTSILLIIQTGISIYDNREHF